MLIVHNGITHGAGVALRSALGAALADLSFALVGFGLGLSLVAVLKTYAPQIKLLSSLILIGFALWMLRTLLWRVDSGSRFARGSRVIGVRGTFLLTIVNPLTIVAFSAFLGRFARDVSGSEIILLGLGVFTGSLLVQVALALSSSLLGNGLFHGKFAAVLQALSIVGIFAFGVSGLWGY